MSPGTSNSTKPLVYWVIGALFSVNMALAGTVYASMSYRFSTDEERIKGVEDITAGVDVINAHFQDLKDAVLELKDGQHEIAKKVDFILSTMSRDHETYNQLVKQYQDALKSTQNKR